MADKKPQRLVSWFVLCPTTAAEDYELPLKRRSVAVKMAAKNFHGHDRYDSRGPCPGGWHAIVEGVGFKDRMRRADDL